MRKILIIFFLGLVVVPQVTLAAWWNPLSWKIFNKIPQAKTQNLVATSTQKVKDQILETKIPKEETDEGKKEMAELTSSKIDFSKYEATIIDQPSSSEKDWFADADQKGWTVFIYTFPNGEKSYYKKEGGKWVKKNNEFEITEMCNGKIWAPCPSDQQFYCPKTGDAQCTNQFPGETLLQKAQRLGIKPEGTPTASKTTSDISDEQKIKMTILAKETIMSFRNSINFEKRATNEYLSLYNQKQAGLNDVISQCEQSKISDQATSKHHMDIFYNGLAARGLLEAGSSEGARLVAEEQAKEDRYVENNYNRCVAFARTLYVPSSSNYSTELRNWLSRLGKFENDISDLEAGLSDGITTVQEMLDYKTSFGNFDTNFSRERDSIDALRRTAIVTSSNTSLLSNQIQQNIDQAKKNLENLASPLQNVTCVAGLKPATYSCKSLNGSQPFICAMGRFGSVSCTSERR